MQVTNGNGGYGFATAAKFSNGLAFAANNTTTFTGALDSSTGAGICMGVTEGTTATGYFGYLCDNGTWYIKDLIGLGTNRVVVGKQVATGSFPYTAQASYEVSRRAGSPGRWPGRLRRAAVRPGRLTCPVKPRPVQATGFEFPSRRGF